MSLSPPHHSTTHTCSPAQRWHTQQIQLGYRAPPTRPPQAQEASRELVGVARRTLMRAAGVAAAAAAGGGGEEEEEGQGSQQGQCQHPQRRGNQVSLVSVMIIGDPPPHQLTTRGQEGVPGGCWGRRGPGGGGGRAGAGRAAQAAPTRGAD